LILSKVMRILCFSVHSMAYLNFGLAYLIYLQMVSKKKKYSLATRENVRRYVKIIQLNL